MVDGPDPMEQRPAQPSQISFPNQEEGPLLLLLLLLLRLSG
ncbi:hypothetical protein [Synechococcus sp. CS-1324]|nr:hypothetical protein [Synechococcus sp. CS-1324]